MIRAKFEQATFGLLAKHLWPLSHVLPILFELELIILKKSLWSNHMYLSSISSNYKALDDMYSIYIYIRLTGYDVPVITHNKIPATPVVAVFTRMSTLVHELYSAVICRMGKSGGETMAADIPV